MNTRYTNRELSLLDFQDRVLAMAEDQSLPLLERVNYVAIVSHNIDEFFQVRVSGLKEQEAQGYAGLTIDGSTPAQQLADIRPRVAGLLARRDRVFLNELLPELENAGIRLSAHADLDESDRETLDAIFEDQIFPVLTPLAVDPAHPFPFISDLSLNLAVLAINEAGESLFARVKVPAVLPRFIVLPDGKRFVPLEEVIATHLDRLFPRTEVLGHWPFRITRTADPSIEEEEAQDLLEAMESALRTQKRSARAVRLEAHPAISPQVLGLLIEELQLDVDDVYFSDAPLDLSGLWSLYGLSRPDLKLPGFIPTTPSRLAAATEPVDFFAEIAKGDILVHHPYESFSGTVGAFLAQAVADPDVLAIKQTLYRTSIAEDPALGGEESIVNSLIEAAELGKQVAVLVELKARFDEQANIRWARLLEQAGAHVAYGVVGLKTHAKVLLVARREGGGVRRYSHIGTGNYNPKTANIYEDLGLFTADAKIGSDLSELFNVLTGFGVRRKYRKIYVAPATLKTKLLKRIREQEALGEEGAIAFKINHLIERDVIDALYAASQTGAKVDLVIRSTCGLIPGVPGLSDNIRVRSVVGRFLEHSRIYRFGKPESADVTYLIGSADLMPRNLSGRVEALAPVLDPVLQGRLEEVLTTEMADDVLAWELSPSGTWSKVPTSKGISTHAVMAESAAARASSGRI
ncbi:MAG: polyphosphate kinase 1 [Acidimicrobiia bacterium]